MEKVTLQWFNEHIQDIFTGECPKVYYCVHETTEINYGDQNDCDLEYCKEHNIPTYMMKRGGGTIVCSKGNIGISAITPVKWGWICHDFLKSFSEYLSGCHLNVEISGNDILVDGYKVASCVELRVGEDLNHIYSTYQISINQDIEAIKHICKKEMVKIPKALSDYGITTEEIVNFCEDYWDNIINN